MMVAFRATAPDNSKSRSASGKSALLIPGFLLFGTEHNLRVVRRQTIAASKRVYVGEIDLGLSGDHELLAGAVNAGGVQRIDVVDERKIIGSDIVNAPAGRVVGKLAQRSHGRLHAEIVQAANAADHTAKRRGQGRLGRVGEMRFAIDNILVNFCLKRLLYPRGGSVDRDPVMAASDAGNRETLRLQPRL